MNLKQWDGSLILHIIDIFSRLTVSVFVARKKISEIIDKIMTCCIGAGYGLAESILTDNGEEFSSEKLIEVYSILNIQVCTTEPYSLFQHGVCEYNYAVTTILSIA